MMSFTVSVQEDDNGELFIELPSELLAETGWKEGDTIEWVEGDNGSYTLIKKEETQ